MKRLLFLLALHSTLFSLAFSGTTAFIGNICRTIAIDIFALLTGLALFKVFVRGVRVSKEIKFFWFSILFSLVSLGFYDLLGCPFLFSDIRELLIPLMILFSSYVLFDINDDILRRDFIVFGVVASFCSVYLVLNTGGFEIYQLYRSGVAKNQIGPFFAQVALVILYYLLSEKDKKTKVVLIVSFVCICALPIYLRARTSLFCVLFGSVFLLCYKGKLRLLLYISLALIFVNFCFGNYLGGIIQESLFANYDISDIDSLTAGRYSRIERSLQMIRQNLLFGASMSDMSQSVFFSLSDTPVHVYLLLKIVKYGIIGGFSFIMAYCGVVYCGWRSIKNNHTTVFLCLLVAIITSFAEYSSPFGPGTSYVICYMLLGRQLRLSWNGRDTHNKSTDRGYSWERLTEDSHVIYRG